MRNIIIGTAGHIDHGKTTLIKKLTGIDTDTLPEEAARGVTINLGFAYYKDSNGRKIGVIDVPGHEKFIKNMVAGVSGIDFILLTIACDDGIMKQTIEHVNISSILGVKNGIIVLTKKDLVTPERIEELKSEIKERFKESFLSSFKIIETSNKDIESIDKLKKLINEEIEKIDVLYEKKDEFRMNIDRVFSVKGFGTVVTGTTLSGEIKQGDMVTLYPSRSRHKIKGIQNHGENVEYLESGNRCALNLSDLEVSETKRGDILSKKSDLVITNRIDGVFTLLKDEYEVKNNTRVRVHLGTSEVIGRVKNIQDSPIKLLQECFIQLELEKDIVVVEGDIGVVRSYSPLDTIGGIKIINTKGERVKKGDSNYIKKLRIILNGDKGEKIISYLEKKDIFLKNIEEISDEIKEKDILIDLKKLNQEKKIIRVAFKVKEQEKNLYISYLNFNVLKNEIEKYFQDFYKKEPLKKGVTRAHLKSKLYNFLEIKEFNNILELLITKDILEENEGILLIKDHRIKLNKEEKKIKDMILNIYKNKGFNLEKYEEILNAVPIKEKEIFNKVHEYLVENGFLIYVGQNYFIMRGFWLESDKRLREHLENKYKITLGEYREILECSRKVALILLEKYDSIGITKREEEYRILKEVRKSE